MKDKIIEKQRELIEELDHYYLSKKIPHLDELSKVEELKSELSALESQPPPKSAEEILPFINKIYDKIREDLRGARLMNVETDDGDRYPLLDHLSNTNTIKSGLEEIDNIVEQIEIEDLLEEYASQQMPSEDNQKRLTEDEAKEAYPDLCFCKKSTYTKGICDKCGKFQD